MIKAHDVSSIVVRAPNWVGDAVMSVAALRELRRLFPNSHITVVSKPGTAEVFAGADYIDDVLVYERAGVKSFFDQVRAWKQREFDLALLFQNAFEAAAISFMARVPLRVGYATERRALLLGHAVPVPGWKQERHEIFYYLNLVAELEKLLTGSTLEPSAPDFGISVSDRSETRGAQAFERAQGGTHETVGSALPRISEQPRQALAGGTVCGVGGSIRGHGSDGRTDWRTERTRCVANRRCDDPTAAARAHRPNFSLRSHRPNQHRRCLDYERHRARPHWGSRGYADSRNLRAD